MSTLLYPGQFAGHQSVVVGTGRSGTAAARLLTFLGARVRVVDVNEPDADTRETLSDLGATLEVGKHSKKQFADADMIVLSPGVPVAKLEKYLKGVAANKIMAEMELASWFVQEPIVAITGTSGKTTTVSLVSAMLERVGKKVFTGGNIGTPLSEYVLDSLKPEKQAEVLVLEASSFQLQNVRSFKPHVAVLLNIAPNHLDYHADIDEYFDAKMNMFRRMTDKDLAILPLNMKEQLQDREEVKARRVYFVGGNRFEGAKLLGAHNQANMEAAWLCARAFGVDEETARAAVLEFEPLANRLEPVAEVDGILFVNDTKATTPDALAAALTSFNRPVRLLAGGTYKDSSAEPLKALIPLMENRVKEVGLFGGSRTFFEEAWEGQIPLYWEKTMEDAFTRLVANAESGDVILLSPATSSFDQYPNYVARGDDFRHLVSLYEKMQGIES